MENEQARQRAANGPAKSIRQPSVGEIIDRLESELASPNLDRKSNWNVSRMSLLAKRCFDVVGVLVIGLLTLPIFVLVAVMVRISGSPAIFSHKRVGRNGKLFGCYKFRTMVPDAEHVLEKLLLSDATLMAEWRENYKLRKDPRVTKFGDFLRRTSLDEMPQLWNVLRGDMSLVGPRPIVEDELQRYGNEAHAYLRAKPGMTGLWQIMGRSNTSYARRVSLDSWYVRNRSLAIDVWILYRTFLVVIRRAGAH